MNPATQHRLQSLHRCSLRLALWISAGLCLHALCLPCPASERVFNLAETPEGQAPAFFRSAVSGEGPVGDWRVRHVDPADITPSAPQSSVATRRAILVQTSRNPTDERFPLLYYEAERYGDFRFTTRVRTVTGDVAQMAGIAFRIQNETNYYVLRISSLGNTAVFYKFVDGIRTPPITAQLEIRTGTWYELAVECRANQIRCYLDGRELFPTLTDNSFLDGYIGFWTKSDAVSHFTDAHVTYTPRESLAQVLVREIMNQYPRVVAVKMIAPDGVDQQLRVIASSDPAEMGTPGNQVDSDVLRKGATFFGKDKAIAEVALPLRDRNGDAVAILRVLLRRSPGQTQAGALSRARPIADLIQDRMRFAGNLKD
jgi:hypothetical protein